MYNHNIALFNVNDIETQDVFVFVSGRTKYIVVFKRDSKFIHIEIRYKRMDEMNAYGFNDYVRLYDRKLLIRNCKVIWIDLKDAEVGHVDPSSIEYQFMIKDELPPINLDESADYARNVCRLKDTTLLMSRLDGRIQTHDSENDKLELSEYHFKKGDQIYYTYPDKYVKNGFRAQILTVF